MLWPKSMICKIRNNELSEKAKIIYLICSTFLTLLNIYKFLLLTDALSVITILNFIYSFVISVIGICWAYKINNQAGSAQFIERYILILFPLNLFSFIISGIIIGCWLFSYYMIFSTELLFFFNLLSAIWSYISSILIVVFLLIIFKYINKKF